jgi:hypothetical protein
LQKLESDLSALHSAAVKALSKIDTEEATRALAQLQARDHLAPMNLGVGARIVLSSNQSERLNSAAAPVSVPETPRPSDIKPTNEVPRVPEDVGAVISEGHRSAFAELTEAKKAAQRELSRALAIDRDAADVARLRRAVKALQRE